MANNSEKLPRPTPEIVREVFGDQKNAGGDSDDAFDDLIIEIDEDEVEQENAPRRKV